VQHIHDGLYLRMNAGFDISTSVSGRIGGIQTEYSGYGLALAGAAGVAIVRNLILFGTLTLDTTTDTSERLSGYSVYADGDVNLYGFGAGLAYYVEIVNMYAAAAVMGMKADLTPTGTSSSSQGMNLSRLGPGLAVLVGKEWWMSENWGLGVATQLLQSWMPGVGSSSGTMRGGSFSLLFSATYN